ncbi:hypothetical protein AB1K84_01060 [Mesobacillus foraminis]|uniref:hypothetical protein n=1 Tax=Mesobacillus foraminis TaxID=279826 RepID=UPI0039A1B77E
MNKLILLNGITGFYDSSGNKPPELNRKQVKEDCFSLISGYGGEVLEYQEPCYPMNFYNVIVKLETKQLHLLLNQFYPFMAFAVSDFTQENIRFIDEPRLEQMFSPFYDVLSTRHLLIPLELKEIKGQIVLVNENDLNSAEKSQIAYWKPKNVGSLVFNYWD